MVFHSLLKRPTCTQCLFNSYNGATYDNTVQSNNSHHGHPTCTCTPMNILQWPVQQLMNSSRTLSLLQFTLSMQAWTTVYSMATTMYLYDDQCMVKVIISIMGHLVGISVLNAICWVVKLMISRWFLVLLLWRYCIQCHVVCWLVFTINWVF